LTWGWIQDKKGSEEILNPEVIMKTTKELPGGYRTLGTLDLQTNKKAAIFFNIAALVASVIFFSIFMIILAWIRPEAVQTYRVNGFQFSVLDALLLIFASVFVLVLHEAVHGIGFWLVTGERPEFGLSLAYAYAAAPDWLIPKRPYLPIALGPFVVITLLGFVLLAFLPANTFFAILVAMVINAGGAVGDLYVAFWLAKQPENCLVSDTGAAITLYIPEEKPSVES
jgi:hypothetical protein